MCVGVVSYLNLEGFFCQLLVLSWNDVCLELTLYITCLSCVPLADGVERSMEDNTTDSVFVMCAGNSCD